MNGIDSGRLSALPPVSALFSRSWAVYRERVFTGAAVLLVTNALALAVLAASWSAAGDGIEVLLELDWDMLTHTHNRRDVFRALPFLAAALALAAWGAAALLVVVAPARVGFGQALSRGLEMLGPVLWVTLLAMLVTAGAYALFLVPGLVVAVAVMFAPFPLVAGEARGLRSLAVSVASVRHRWWPVLLRTLLLWGIGLGVWLPLQLLLASARTKGAALAIAGATLLFQLLFTPFAFVYLLRLYGDLKETRPPLTDDRLRRVSSRVVAWSAAGWVVAVALILVVPPLLVPLPKAASEGPTWVVKAKLLARPSHHAVQRALAGAVAGGRIEVARLLLARGASVNEAVDGRPLLTMVGEDLEMAGFLLDQGADVDARDGGDETPLMDARLPLARVLVERGADVNARDGLQQTALMNVFTTHLRLANLRDDLLPFVALLLERGADPNARDFQGDTVLHHAVEHLRESPGDADPTIAVVQRLLASGADPRAENARGVTPLDLTERLWDAEQTRALRALLERRPPTKRSPRAR